MQIGTVRVDVDPHSSIDVRGDARNLPFKDESFAAVIFSEVLEHLPTGTETKVLREIARLLIPGGRLVVTTPADHPAYNLLDLAWFLGHRHYQIGVVCDLVEQGGFRVVRAFRNGGPGDALRNLLYQLFVYPGLVPSGREDSFLRQISLLQHPIQERDSPQGFTIFVEAIKVDRAAWSTAAF